MKLLLITAGFILLVFTVLLWAGKRLFIRRNEMAYENLRQLYFLVLQQPHGHFPRFATEQARSLVQDYDDVMSSGLYPGDQMLQKLAVSCSWLHNEEDFRIMFPS